MVEMRCKMKKKIEYFICICVIAIVIWGIVSFIKSATSYTENTYQLSELDGGTYAIYYTTHSNQASDYLMTELYHCIISMWMNHVIA